MNKIQVANNTGTHSLICSVNVRDSYICYNAIVVTVLIKWNKKLIISIAILLTCKESVAGMY